MRAIITRPNEDGSYNEVGMNNRTVTGQYKTKKGLLRYGIPDHFKGKLRIELFHLSILGNAYETFYYHKH